MGEQTTDGVRVARFESVGDWEVLYVDGESVKQNHIGRVDVLSYLEPGMTIQSATEARVNLPEGETRYPSDLDEVLEDDRYDITEDDL
jgi:hypothetical protein